METPVTPKKARPKPIARSHTSNGVLTSPTKDHAPTSGSPQEAKRHHHHHHHFDLFHHHNSTQNQANRRRMHSSSNPPHHTHDKDNRTHDDRKPGAKIANLRQHVVPNAVSELSHIVNPAGNHARGISGVDGSVKSTSRRNSRDAPSDLPSASRVPSHVVTQEDVEREVYRRRQQESELQNAFDRLSEQAQRSARRFDFIYYSALEKLTRLFGMIGHLQELCRGSEELRDEFEAATNNLVAEAYKQIDAFHEFAEQQETVQSLETRIDVGKKRTERLSERLENAKKKAQAWEEAETEWQARATKRLTIAQFVLSAVVVLIAVLIAARRYNDTSRDTNVTELDMLMNSSNLPSVIVDDLAGVRSRRLAAVEQSSSTVSVSAEETLPADTRLTALDEL